MFSFIFSKIPWIPVLSTCTAQAEQSECLPHSGSSSEVGGSRPWGLLPGYQGHSSLTRTGAVVTYNLQASSTHLTLALEDQLQCEQSFVVSVTLLGLGSKGKTVPSWRAVWLSCSAVFQHKGFGNPQMEELLPVSKGSHIPGCKTEHSQTRRPNRTYQALWPRICFDLFN